MILKSLIAVCGLPGRIFKRCKKYWTGTAKGLSNLWSLMKKYWHNQNYMYDIETVQDRSIYSGKSDDLVWPKNSTTRKYGRKSLYSWSKSGPWRSKASQNPYNNHLFDNNIGFKFFLIFFGPGFRYFKRTTAVCLALNSCHGRLRFDNDFLFARSYIILQRFVLCSNWKTDILGLQ